MCYNDNRGVMKMKKIRKAVIPVAGMGTRFLPVTKAVAKEMLPIVNKPTLQYIIEECVASGIEEILLITSPYKKIIEDHFDQSFELETRLEKNGKLKELEMVKNISKLCKIYYIRQGEPLGRGESATMNPRTSMPAIDENGRTRNAMNAAAPSANDVGCVIIWSASTKVCGSEKEIPINPVPLSVSVMEDSKSSGIAASVIS